MNHANETQITSLFPQYSSKRCPAVSKRWHDEVYTLFPPLAETACEENVTNGGFLRAVDFPPYSRSRAATEARDGPFQIVPDSLRGFGPVSLRRLHFRSLSLICCMFLSAHPYAHLLLHFVVRSWVVQVFQENGNRSLSILTRHAHTAS
eukprot:RCo050118